MTSRGKLTLLWLSLMPPTFTHALFISSSLAVLCDGVSGSLQQLENQTHFRWPTQWIENMTLTSIKGIGYLCPTNLGKEAGRMEELKTKHIVHGVKVRLRARKNREEKCGDSAYCVIMWNPRQNVVVPDPSSLNQQYLQSAIFMEHVFHAGSWRHNCK